MNENYEISLTAAQLQIIGQALQEAPFKIAQPILAELQKQIAAIEEARAQNVDPPALKAVDAG